MHARDASGRKVSLLNDDAAAQYEYAMPQRLSYAATNHMISQPFHGFVGRSASSSPNTPELHRSDSYDSQASTEPISPMTPNLIYTDFAATPMYAEGHSPYDDYLADAPAMVGSKRPGSFGDSRSVSYDEDAAASPSGTALSDRPGKRYPCRYRDSHGCEKTFTTSGHASRHSKIHTAEKAVQCTFAGCSKKFTRADNMKQHLETHFKDKSRASTSRPSLTGRRSSSSGKSSSSSSSSGRRPTDAMPLPSPAAGAWDMRGLNLPLMSRPSAARTPSSGLDALAMAVACQEGHA